MNPIEPGLLVENVGTHHRAVSRTNVAPGGLIADLAGVVVGKPDRYTIQLGKAEHLDAFGVVSAEDLSARFPWRFLNHACRPNSAVRGRRLVATTTIQAGEEVTFNYNTTEFDMAEPFACRCGAPECRGGMVRGYRYLGAAEREAIRDATAPHVLALAASERSAASVAR